MTNKCFIIVLFKRIFEYYALFEIWFKLQLFLLILGGKINKRNGNIIYSNSNENISKIPDKNTKEKAQITLDFEFKESQKRRLNEYDDLQIYLNNHNHNYVIGQNGPNNENFIEEVRFGVIDLEKLTIDQRTSANVWISALDKNLSQITSKTIDLAFFEKQNSAFMLDLNNKFFIKIEPFLELKKELGLYHEFWEIEEILDEIFSVKRIKGNVTIPFKI